jgi:hypothetical protein
MPRIAAALLVVVTIAACIGFNTRRYPVVWEMAANSPHLPSLEEPAGQSATEPEQQPGELQAEHTPIVAAISGPPASVDDSDSWESDYEPESYNPPSYDSNEETSQAWDDTSYDSGYSEYDRGYSEDHSTRLGAGAESGHFDTSPVTADNKPLVPVADRGQSNAGFEPGDSESDAAFGRPDYEPLSVSIYRLPPTDQVWPSPHPFDTAEQADQSVPIYPSTGAF